MSTHRQLVTRGFSFIPTTLQEAQQYADIIANSGICPEGFKGRPNDVLIVLQLGNELGLKPMQALRSLGAVNGMPFAYGDGLLALVKRHPQFDDMKEWFEGNIKDKTLTAFCTIIRKGKIPVTKSFDIEDAQRAGLWGKKGTWTHYPQRMLQHRARGFAARDAFPDALYGLMSQEEAMSISEVSEPVKIQGKGIAGLEATLGIIEGEIVNNDVIDISPEPVEKVEENRHINLFLETIEKNNIPSSKQEVWLDEYNVLSLEQLPEKFMEKVINHYQPKEQNQDGL